MWWSGLRGGVTFAPWNPNPDTYLALALTLALTLALAIALTLVLAIALTLALTCQHRRERDVLGVLVPAW